MTEIPKLQFSFRGRLAENHEMNFYESARFQYGAARFIYTLEKYRQHKKIVERLQSKVDIDLRVRAPTPGSYIQEILIYAAPIVADCAIKAPIDALIAYVLDKTFPTGKAESAAVRIAEERTKQSVQETARFQMMKEVSLQGYASTSQALTIIEDELKNKRKIEKELLNTLYSHKKELNSTLQREKILREWSRPLEEITPEDDKRLITQTRNSVSEWRIPFRSSADSIEISGSGDRTPFSYANDDTFEYAFGEKTDDIPTYLEGTIKMYDRETGHGRFRSGGFPKPLAFHVPAGMRQSIRPALLAAMDKDLVGCVFYIVRDRLGTAKRLILNSIKQ